ncbi:MAG: hypothetical protein IPL99_29515 [Candidatus Competibacteraceae bacterium]|nr:hypothetical protein [Candidatus Competibacteraceae bacterium]
MAASPALFPAAPLPALVGFSGARRLSPVFRPQVAAVVASVLAAGRSVAVGCAGGADAFVRAAAPAALVFSAAAFGSGPASFARRSAALVAAVAEVAPVPVWWCFLLRPARPVCFPRRRFPPASVGWVPGRGRPPRLPLAWACRWWCFRAAFRCCRRGAGGVPLAVGCGLAASCCADCRRCCFCHLVRRFFWAVVGKARAKSHALLLVASQRQWLSVSW